MRKSLEWEEEIRKYGKIREAAPDGNIFKTNSIVEGILNMNETVYFKIRINTSTEIILKVQLIKLLEHSFGYLRVI